MRTRGLIWPLLIFLALILARRYLDVVEVRGRSMLPALLPGDRLLAVRLEPRVGDVALALDPRDPQRELIKRVIRIDRFGVFLGGDNPAASTDARTFGAIPTAVVRWRVVGRYWPLSRGGRVPSAAAIEGGEPACAFPDALIAGG